MTTERTMEMNRRILTHPPPPSDLSLKRASILKTKIMIFNHHEPAGAARMSIFTLRVPGSHLFNVTKAVHFAPAKTVINVKRKSNLEQAEHRAKPESRRFDKSHSGTQ